MGNRESKKDKTASEGSKKPEVKGHPRKNGPVSRDKDIISCPDLSSEAVPCKIEGDPSCIDVKIYRSFSNVSDPADKRLGALVDPPPDIRVYRRSTGSLALVDAAADRSQTLPRSFGRSRSAAAAGPHRRDRRRLSNGTLPRERRADDDDDGAVRRSSTLGSGYSVGPTKGGPGRTISTASMCSSIGYKVNSEDFPDTSTIIRKLNLFETSFVRNLVEAFCSHLSQLDLLSLLSVAIRPDRANQQVSLLHYLQSSEVPANLHEQGTSLPVEYLLTIPQMLFQEIFRIRQENISDVRAWFAIGRHILSCQAMEAANELSRVFEYQLSLMPEGLPTELLCRHSAKCALEFLRRNNKHLDRNTIVQGVFKGDLEIPEVSPKFSIVLGEKELKWNLFEILKKPGLRKERFLLSSNEEIEIEQSPWKFFSSLNTDPMLYGYRGLTIDWDFASCTYQLDGEDEASFPEETDWRPDDFHRDYRPYRRLIGLAVMRDFCAAATAGTSKEGLTVGDYVRGIQGGSYSRDRIQPVYRPLGDGDGLRDRLPLGLVDLGNADTLRLRRGKSRSDASEGKGEEGESRTGAGWRPHRGSDSDGGVPREKWTPSRISMDTSPISQTDPELSPASTPASQNSQHSNKPRYINGFRETGSPKPEVQVRGDDSAAPELVRNSPNHSNVQVTDILLDVRESVASEGATRTTYNGSVASEGATRTTYNGSVGDNETDSVRTDLKPIQAVSNISRRRTITSDV